jgi:1,2-dihydroxy-3-keto-5-methylthiopentene dioxygenase
MTLMQVRPVDAPQQVLLETADPEVITTELSVRGIRFERYQSRVPVDATAADAQVIDSYWADLERLRDECGQPNLVVERIQPHEGTPELRGKFLNEHYHEENEIWLFADGRACFYLHLADQICIIICEAGDLLLIPAATRHWFDMGPQPEFCAIRLYLQPDSSFQAEFTGDPIPDRFPRLLETVLSAG